MKRASFLAPILALLLHFVFTALSPGYAQSSVTEPDRAALYQRGLDLKSGLNVLMISLQPGDEDFGALAFYRYGKGARIQSAYVTNGESGDNDLEMQYPFPLAATRREEATRALSLLDGAAYFLNMPELAAARDSAWARNVWRQDTLQWKLMKMISDFKPDVIFLCKDRLYPKGSIRWDLLHADLLEAVKRVRPLQARGTSYSFVPFALWGVGRVLVASPTGVTPPTSAIHPILQKSYDEIGNSAGAAYQSLHRQLDPETVHAPRSFRQSYPNALRNPRTPDDGLPVRVSPRYRPTEKLVNALASSTLALSQKSSTKVGEERSLLSQLLSVMDSLDYFLARSMDLNPADRKSILHWKADLETLRSTLLGVKIYYHLSDSVVTNLQLSFLTIDSVAGLKGGGSTELYFPGVGQGWAIDEELRRQYPLRLNDAYRILSPSSLPYNVPAPVYGLNTTEVGTSFPVFVIHKSSRREQNFIERIPLTFFIAPRFSVEVLTPVVRAADSERVVIRLTNNSRDGVADRIDVRDSLVESNQSNFRLSTKGSVHQDTLYLRWIGEPPYGTQLYSLVIEDQQVTHVAARRFDVQVNRDKRVGLITAYPTSSTSETLRRIGVPAKRIDVNDSSSHSLVDCDVVIVDRRALTLVPELRHRAREIQQFVKLGGHLVVLSQDADIWNAASLLQGIRLTESQLYDEEVAILADTTHPLMTTPNRITPEDWSNWLYRRADGRVEEEMVEGASVPVRSILTRDSFLVTFAMAKGTVTIVSLDLHHQFLNVHGGAFRLLANLISY